MTNDKTYQINDPRGVAFTIHNYMYILLMKNMLISIYP